MNVVNQVDAFVAGKLGYFLLMYQFVGGNQQVIDYTTANHMAPITFPSTYLNNGTGIDLDAGCIIFWHGNISIEVNGIKLYKAWDCSQHLYIPRGQATPTPANARADILNGPWSVGLGMTPGYPPPWQPNYQNEYDASTDASYPLEPLPVFSGAKQSIVMLNLPSTIPATIAPFNATGIGYGVTFILKACLKLTGILAQDAGLQ